MVGLCENGDEPSISIKWEFLVEQKKNGFVPWNEFRSCCGLWIMYCYINCIFFWSNAARLWIWKDRCAAIHYNYFRLFIFNLHFWFLKCSSILNCIHASYEHKTKKVMHLHISSLSLLDWCQSQAMVGKRIVHFGAYQSFLNPIFCSSQI